MMKRIFLTKNPLSNLFKILIFLENLILYELISNAGFASLIFLFGMFICTATKNIPLNNKLAGFDFNNPSCNPEIEWKNYYNNWVKWNHIRTASCFLSMALLLVD